MSNRKKENNDDTVEISNEILNQQVDNTKIDDNVVTLIAGIAASKVEGVVSMSGGVVGNIAERIGRKDLTRGIKVETTENKASIEISVHVKYGTKIHQVAKQIQDKVREAINSMTGLEVTSVTVNVQGVELEEYISNAEEVEEEEEK